MGRKKKQTEQTNMNFTSMFKELEETLLSVNANARRSTIIPNDQEARSKVLFRDVEDEIPKFTGENEMRVDYWEEEFARIADLFKWSELEKLIYAKKCITGKAKTILESERTPTTYEQLIELLKKEFKVECTSAEIHKKLIRTIKKPEQTIMDFFLEMKKIGIRGKVEDESIMEYTIDGIKDDQAKLFLYEAKNLDEFKEKIKILDKMNKKNPVQVKESKAVRCYNCGKAGHITKECRRKEPKCFKCNEYGHKAPECSKKTVNCLNASNYIKSVSIKNKNLNSLIDTGSMLTCIKRSIAQELDCNITGDGIEAIGIGKNKVKTLGTFHELIKIDGNEFDANIHVVDDNILNYDVLIGNDVLWGTIISSDSENGIKITKHHINELNKLEYVDDNLDKNNLHTVYQQDIMNLQNNYNKKQISYKECPITLKIILKNDTPIYQRPRRLSPSEKIIVDKQIEEWLHDGVVRESSSEFASPIVLVNKKDGKKRLCVDYRKLNKEIIMNRYPLPLIEDHINHLQNATVFTTLDLENGFFHVKVDEDSQKYTSFVTPTGQYEFLRVPFGLCTAPSVFQRFINVIFRPLVTKGEILIYMDDIIIPGTNEDDCMGKLEKTLKIAEEYNLTIKWSKCQFLQTEVQYLGYRITKGTIQPSQEKTKAISKFPLPKNIKDVQKFLGLTGYFRKFIQNYALLTKPISDLLRKGEKFELTNTHIDAIKELKSLLINEPILKLYNPGADTELHTDASKFGFGAILLQRDSEDRKFHPVYYYSKKTTPTQEKYNSYELEVLAIVSAVKKLRVYLLGVPFKIITDCSAFKATMEKKELTSRIGGWALYLEDFEYKLEHRKGSRLKHADALSRFPVINVLQDTITERIVAAQKHDPNLIAIRHIIEREPYDGYCLENEIIYKEINHNKLLCVPSAMQSELIRREHERGHFAKQKTEDLIQQNYYIPKIKQKVERCVSNCIPCIVCERKSGKQEGFLHPIHKEPQPFYTFHVDHLGPLESTNKNYKFIFSVIDAFSKFCWLFPTKSTTSSETIEKMEFLESIFGNPHQIITDRGTAFTSEAFKNFCKHRNIMLHHITTGVPRANGQVERLHRVVIPMLSKLSIEDPTLWYKHVKKVQKIINSTNHRAISCTPFEVMFGVKMKTSEDTEINAILEEELLKYFNEERCNIREKARQQIEKIQKENVNTYNKKRKKPIVYKQNDMVAIKRTQFGTAMKLKKKFLGPYRIEKNLTKDRYEVKKIGQGEGPIKTTVSVDHMKKWVDEQEEEDTEWEVEDMESDDDDSISDVPDISSNKVNSN